MFQILLAGSSVSEARLVTEAMLDGLRARPAVPAIYRGHRQAVCPHRPPQTERRMLLASGQPWIPLKAQQWFSVRTPGFVWYATLHIGPIPIVRARNMYRTGAGHMLIKAPSLITVADAKGRTSTRVRWCAT